MQKKLDPMETYRVIELPQPRHSEVFLHSHPILQQQLHKVHLVFLQSLRHDVIEAACDVEHSQYLVGIFWIKYKLPGWLLELDKNVF